MASLCDGLKLLVPPLQDGLPLFRVPERVSSDRMAHACDIFRCPNSDNKLIGRERRLHRQQIIAHTKQSMKDGRIGNEHPFRSKYRIVPVALWASATDQSYPRRVVNYL
jgi:hypothetical protein